MSIETLIRICTALNVSADYLLLGKTPSQIDRSKAEGLLKDIPDEYYPLVVDSLRLLLKIVATVQLNHSETPATPPEKRIHIAARSGDHMTVELAPPSEDALTNALANLKKQPKSFSD